MKLTISLDYDNKTILGTLDLTDEGERLFRSGKYCVVPRLEVSTKEQKVIKVIDAGMVLIDKAVSYAGADRPKECSASPVKEAICGRSNREIQ